MRLPTILLALTFCSALPARADKRVDDAIAKAEAQLAKGKPDEAIKLLQKAATQAPRDPEPSLALAKLYTRVGRLDDAGAALGKAGELAASAPLAVKARVRASQSVFALRVGTTGDALAFARQAVEAAAGAESLAALARAHARTAVAAARETAARAVRAAPDSAAAQTGLGAALFAARLDAEAETAYRRAVQLEPGSATAGAGLALALAGQGKAAPALEAARAATQADAHSAEAQAALGLAALAQDPEDRKSDAMAAVQQASLLEPKNALVTLQLGRVFESRGQLDDAATAYGRAAELDPSWPAPRVAALSLRLRKGDAAGALTGLRALPEDLRKSGDSDLLLGRILSQKEEWVGALLALDRAVVALPGLAEAQALRGAAAYNTGDLKLAADAYGRAVELRPDTLAYLSSYATHLAYDGRADEGLAALQKVVARPEGQQAESFMQLGAIYRSFKPPRVNDAVAAYEKALKLDPKNGQAALGVALSYRAGKQWPRAISAYEKVEQAFPRLAGEAQLGTAWCHLSSGDISKARFFTGLAARAGADVGAIRQALSQPVGSGSAGEDLSELAGRLRSKNGGIQARAAKGLLDLGGPAVPALADALQRPATSPAVRQLIVDGLGTLGPAARDALPQLDRLAKAAPTEPRPDDPVDAKALRDREARLASSAQSASEKIRSRPR
ncbi:MAG TPA: tetratricopeptide repeat protein [Vicinamibacteria bacterium]|nr:tetratricopeptide repeat protein [Vicinamibacteria bacterium]